MTTRQFALPDLGEGLTESELVSWQVAVGDTIELNQVIAEVETAKALVELPSPFAGVVRDLLVAEGTTVQVGSPIVSVDVQDDADAPVPAAVERTSVLVGYGPPVEGGARPRRAVKSGRGASVGGGEISTGSIRSDGGEISTGSIRTGAERPRSTPPVRRLASERGIDIATVRGTGDDGMVTREDVIAAGAAVTVPAGGERRIPVRGVRKATAQAMVASAFTAPHVTVFLDVDVTRSLALLESLRAEPANSGHRITVLSLAARAVLLAVRGNPAVNAHWDDDAGDIVEYAHVNLGIAAATPRGLLVPYIRDAGSLAFMELCDALSELTTVAREGRTTPEGLTGGTLTISNVGVFGVDAGTPILNPGEAAILALGAVRSRPWEHEGELALRSVMTLSLSFDHRVVDGEQGARFLADIGRLLEDPARAFTLA